MTLPKSTYKKKYISQHGRCFYCGEYLSDSKIEIDHIIPRSVSRSDAVSNLCLACKHCNRAKSNKTLTEFHEAVMKKFPEKLIRGQFYFNFLGLYNEKIY